MTVHAIRQYAFGRPDELRFEPVPDPQPGQNQVLIRVESAGVHLIDTVIRQGVETGAFARPALPMTPGREVAGVVAEVGSDVQDEWMGRRVVAHLGMASGGYAEVAVASVDSLHELPDALTADAAVAMIGTGRTTLAILETAAIGPDDVVLVTAAAGGIGSLAVQAGRNVGATVIGAAGGEKKAAIASELGASIAVDYSHTAWADRVRGALGDRDVTVALDGVGGEIGRSALELLGVGGRLVLFGWSSGSLTALTADDLFRSSLTVTAAIGPRIQRRPGGLRALEAQALHEAAAGRLTPLVGEPFALRDAARAHEAIGSRATTGKVVLRP